MTAVHDHKHEFGPREEDLARCVHCGFCLQACPTYVVLGLETESPRGRIALSRAVSEGRIEPTPSVVAHFDLCLQCRACETACPSGVPYGRIIEDTRALVQSRPDKPASWKFRAALLRLGFSSTRRLRWAFSALRLYQRSPLAPLMRRVLPKKLRQMEQMLPKLPARFFSPPEAAGVPKGEVKANVAMLSGCTMPMTHPGAPEATAPLDAKVTYQDSCHLVHAQRIREAPRQVMRAIPGLELAEMATPDRCCGSAGIYNITQTDMSRRLLEDKMDDCPSTGCDVLATANPGCMLQLELGVKLRGGNQRVMHVVELLDEAYLNERSV